MTAFFLSAVITRGLETTLPRLSASSADSSMLTRLPLPRFRIERANWPAAPGPGGFTFICSGWPEIDTRPVDDVPENQFGAPSEPAPGCTSEAEPREAGLLLSGLVVSNGV